MFYDELVQHHRVASAPNCKRNEWWHDLTSDTDVCSAVRKRLLCSPNFNNLYVSVLGPPVPVEQNNNKTEQASDEKALFIMRRRNQGLQSVLQMCSNGTLSEICQLDAYKTMS